MNNCDSDKIIGKISSIETMGLVDGPGVRTVIFMQGCPLRCKYCHNPETWDPLRQGYEYTPEELAACILRYKNYMKHGGVTFSGGEPLLQAEFLSLTSEILKKNEIHICLDTSGAVILDLKAVDPAQYKEITGKRMEPFLAFLELLQHKNKKLWLRTVIVPGINNEPSQIAAIQKFANRIKNVEKIEFLPYHKMGVQKYQKLGISYPLEGTPELTEDEIQYPKGL